MLLRALEVIVISVLMAGPALAASPLRHSGRITAIDRARHTLTLEEMGPWTSGHPALMTRSIEIGPATKFDLAVRTVASAAGGGWPGGFSASPLTSSDVRPSDYATVTVEQGAGLPRAVSVEIVRPHDDGARHRAEREGQ